LIGCDVPGLLKINNKTSSPVHIRISLQEEFKKRYSSDEVNIKPEEYSYLSYGFGTRWTDVFIGNYAEKIVDTIYLNVGNMEYYCSSMKCKQSLFNKLNRKSKRKLEITVDSSLIKKLFREIE